MHKTTKRLGLGALALAGLGGCASLMGPDYDALMAQMLKSSFRDQGIATVDRLKQEFA